MGKSCNSHLQTSGDGTDPTKGETEMHQRIYLTILIPAVNILAEIPLARDKNFCEVIKSNESHSHSAREKASKASYPAECDEEMEDVIETSKEEWTRELTQDLDA